MCLDFISEQPGYESVSSAVGGRITHNHRNLRCDTSLHKYMRANGMWSLIIVYKRNEYFTGCETQKWKVKEERMINDKYEHFGGSTRTFSNYLCWIKFFRLA